MSFWVFSFLSSKERTLLIFIENLKRKLVFWFQWTKIRLLESILSQFTLKLPKKQSERPNVPELPAPMGSQWVSWRPNQMESRIGATEAEFYASSGSTIPPRVPNEPRELQWNWQIWRAPQLPWRSRFPFSAPKPPRNHRQFLQTAHSESRLCLSVSL